MARFWFKIGLKKLIHMFEWARMRVFDCHRSTNPTTASLILNGARLLGAPTDPLVTMFASLHVIGVGRRASLRFDDGCVERSRYPISVGIFFSCLGEERGTPLASSRITTDPRDIFEAITYIHRPWPTWSGLAVVWLCVLIAGLSSSELPLIIVLISCNVKTQVSPRAAAWRNKICW